MTKLKAEVETVETAEVETVETAASFEDALKPKTEKVKGNGDRLGLYLVLTGESARVVKLALEKVHETNYAAYIRRLVLADLKARLNHKA